MDRNKTKPPLTTADIMNRGARALRGETTALSAVNWLVDHGYSGAPVVDEAGRVVGVFSEHDSIEALVAAANEGMPVGNVAAYMTREVQRVAPGALLLDVARQFVEGNHRRLLVTDEAGHLLGLITRRDLVRSLSATVNPEKRLSTYDILQRLWR